MSATVAAELTVIEAQKAGRELLNGVADTPGLDADLILAALLDCDRTTLFARSEDIVPDGIGAAYIEAVHRRASGVPVAYLTGRKDWYGLTLAVSPAVLIPRPETETLVDLAVRRASSMARPFVADVGTGSGAIAIAIAASLPTSIVTGVDISADALGIAAENVRAHDLEDRVRLIVGDLIQPLSSAPDLIVANLPYLPVSDRRLVRPEVLSEPAAALFAGDDGTDAYGRLLEQLSERGWTSTIMLETDPRHAGRMLALAAGCWPGGHIDIKQDLAGHDRYVTIEPVS